MSKTTPDHHDAELMLKVYDLRREPVLREMRVKIVRDFWPTTYEELTAISSNWEHPLNTAWRQVSSYWEMVYAMARHGIVHPDYWVEGNGEGMFLYAKVLPFLERFRKEASPTAFTNAEWIANNCASGQRISGMFSKRIQARLAAK